MTYIYEMDPKGNVTIHINAKDLAANGFKHDAFLKKETMPEATTRLIAQMLAENAVTKEEEPAGNIPAVPIRIDSYNDGSVDVVIPKGCNLKARMPEFLSPKTADPQDANVEVAGFKQPDVQQPETDQSNPMVEMLKNLFLQAMEQAMDENGISPCDGCEGDCDSCDYAEEYDEEYDDEDTEESDIVGVDDTQAEDGQPKKNPYAADNIYDSRYLEANVACAAVDKNIKDTGMASIKLVQPKLDNITRLCRMIKPYAKKLEIARSTLYKTRTDDGYILLISAPHKTYPMICTLLMEHGYPTDDICWRADKGIFDAYCDEHCELICKDAINKLAKL